MQNYNMGSLQNSGMNYAKSPEPRTYSRLTNNRTNTRVVNISLDKIKSELDGSLQYGEKQSFSTKNCK